MHKTQLVLPVDFKIKEEISEQIQKDVFSNAFNEPIFSVLNIMMKLFREKTTSYDLDSLLEDYSLITITTEESIPIKALIQTNTEIPILSIISNYIKFKFLIIEISDSSNFDAYYLEDCKFNDVFVKINQNINYIPENYSGPGFCIYGGEIKGDKQIIKKNVLEFSFSGCKIKRDNEAYKKALSIIGDMIPPRMKVCDDNIYKRAIDELVDMYHKKDHVIGSFEIGDLLTRYKFVE